MFWVCFLFFYSTKPNPSPSSIALCPSPDIAPCAAQLERCVWQPVTVLSF